MFHRTQVVLRKTSCHGGDERAGRLVSDSVLCINFDGKDSGVNIDGLNVL